MKIQYNSINGKQFYLSIPGKAGKPHQEAGQPLGGRDWCQSWLQGEKHQHHHHHHHQQHCTHHHQHHHCHHRQQHCTQLNRGFNVQISRCHFILNLMQNVCCKIFSWFELLMQTFCTHVSFFFSNLWIENRKSIMQPKGARRLDSHHKGRPYGPVQVGNAHNQCSFLPCSVAH